MGFRVRKIGFWAMLAGSLVCSRLALAQDPPRFQPPRPPSLDDFDDADDDLDIDQPARPQAPPPPPQQGGQNQVPPPVMSDFRPTSSAGGGDQGKFRFKVVDGEFYEKGKPRGRTPQNKRANY